MYAKGAWGLATKGWVKVCRGDFQVQLAGEGALPSFDADSETASDTSPPAQLPQVVSLTPSK